MKNRIKIIIIFCISFVHLYGQEYKTEPLSSEIHSIQITRNGDFMQLPILDIDEGGLIRLSFDRISEDSFNRLRYKIVHCNADWTPSSLSSIEYNEGFDDNLIEDYASSLNTTIGYTNFRLDIPNQDVSLKLSGNYTIVVYEEDNPNNILLTACFSILDYKVSMNGNMTSQTLIDSNKSHQQISFTINHPDLTFYDPHSELKVYVRQNNRLDNQKINIQPTYIYPNRLVYDQNRSLIFEAGNEYRRFEIPSHRYNGLRVMQTIYKRPYYFTYLYPDKIREGTRYIYDEDQDGKFLIRNAEGSDSDIEADYFFVNFSLEVEDPFIENVYINGNFTNDHFTDKYQMMYNPTEGTYNLALMMKQGAYNYQYLLEKNIENYTTTGIEGNYYETENEYQVLIYHRPPGQRYDSLIGYLKIGN